MKKELKDKIESREFFRKRKKELAEKRSQMVLKIIEKKQGMTLDQIYDSVKSAFMLEQDFLKAMLKLIKEGKIEGNRGYGEYSIK